MFAPPRPGDQPFHDAVRLADWVELNLLMEEEASLSIADVTDELADIPPDDSDDSERRSSGYWESAERNAESAFTELRQRSEWLEDHYALEILRDVATPRNGVAPLDIYKFLVLLRARQLYPNELQDDGKESGLLFEELAKHAIGAYMGSKREHRVRFGVAGGGRGDGLPQPLGEAVGELSNRMFEEAGVVNSGDRGDFKADALSWKPFRDQRPGQLVLIGQATISEGRWVHDEPPPNRWTDRRPPDARLIRFLARPLTAVAFPETLSLTPPNTLQGLPFSSIPFDRLRLWEVLRDEILPEDLVKRINDWGSQVGARLPK